MTNEQLADIVLLCTRALIDVVVDCTGGPSDMATLHRVANIRQVVTDYHHLVSIKDVDELRAAIGAMDASMS